MDAGKLVDVWKGRGENHVDSREARVCEIENVVYSFQGTIERERLSGIIEDMDLLSMTTSPLGDWMDPETMTRYVKFEHHPEPRYIIEDVQTRKGDENGPSRVCKIYRLINGDFIEVV